MSRRPVIAVCAALVAALLGGTVHASATPVRPAPVSQAAQTEPPAGPVDEEYEFYKQLVRDVADHAADVEVRDAARAALAVGTKEKLVWFLDHGQAEAQARADQRKAAEKAENRRKVEEWARTGGPNVKSGAQAALNAGDQAIADFVAYGYEIALKKDKQQAEDDEAERKRIVDRVRGLVEQGGPQVKVEGEAILALGDYAGIREFYLTGYHEANKRDHEFQQVIQKALEDRNRAITELDQFARRAEAAANARAEIMRANIDAVKALEDGVLAMQLAVKATHRADRIFQEDKAVRPAQPGRTGELQSLHAETVGHANRAKEHATRSAQITQQAQNAAVRLVETGQTTGLDWAKVTIGIGHAVEASALAAETASHAAHATAADSAALDHGQAAEKSAGNARRYREEAVRQAEKAEELAAAAKKQHDIAVAARDRAAEQKNIAAQKAAQARQHAANARTARANAETTSRNAVATSKTAVDAAVKASELKGGMDHALSEARRMDGEVRVAAEKYGKKEKEATDLEAALKKAREEAIKNGQNADEVTKDLKRQVDTARGAANASRDWASRSQAAAARARESARLATIAANDASRAAANAQRAAVEARRAADEAHRLATETANAAINSKSMADMTFYEAETSVREANESVYQSTVADRAAAAAAASAELIIDPVRAAEAVLRPYAAINADARRALDAASKALLIGEEQSRLAREKATEAAAAAARAKKAAEEAVNVDVKLAYQAASRAAEAAKSAADWANGAHVAAGAAAQHAGAAGASAATAGRWASSARADSVAAGNAAAVASNAAATAGRAAASAERIYEWASRVRERLHAFSADLETKLKGFQDAVKEAERFAREESERERQRLNQQALDILTYIAFCPKIPIPGLDKCNEMNRKVGQAILDGLAAAGNFLADNAMCLVGDEEACKRFYAAWDKIREFDKKAAQGFYAGLTEAFEGIWKIGECVYEAVGGDTAKCGELLKGMKYAIENPYTWLNLDEWQRDPATAFGKTAFGVSTSALAGLGIGGRVVRAAANKLDGGSGLLSRGIAHLDAFRARVHESFRAMPHSLAEILNLNIRIDGPDVRFDTSVAIVDGALHRLDSFTLRPDGGAPLVDGARIRLEGGELQLADGRARLEGAKLKVEPPRQCPASVMRAQDPFCGPLRAPTENSDGSYVHDVDLASLTGVENLHPLPVRLSPEHNKWANELMAKAKAVEPHITEVIKVVAERLGGIREGLAHLLKDKGLPPYPSLKRKVFEETLPEKLGQPTRSPESVRDKMNDTVRYTVVFQPENYTEMTRLALRDLGAQFEEKDFKNFWERREKEKGKPYPGINVTYEHQGVLFEVQFHTPESYRAKSKEHDNYGENRSLRAARAWAEVNPDLVDEDRVTLVAQLLEEEVARNEQARRLFAPVVTPVNAAGIKGVK